MTRLAVLLSGRGSNFLAIASAIREGKLDAEIVVVISNRADVGGIEAAAKLGISTVVIPSKGTPKDEYDRQLIAELHKATPDLICLAGYMRVLSPTVVNEFRGRILNIHPSLLPSFPGLDAQRQALEHGVKITGCTVHFVDEGLDSGPIILQAAVPVVDGDTVQTLSARILKQEHSIYSQAIAVVAETRLAQ
jgi:phosphoribosylglycinamide formyltransferase 1